MLRGRREAGGEVGVRVRAEGARQGFGEDLLETRGAGARGERDGGWGWWGGGGFLSGLMALVVAGLGC